MVADVDLLRLMQKHPERGLEKLMDQYMGLVYTIVAGKLAESGSREDVEETVSDVFYSCYEQRSALDLTKGSLKAYLATLARRKAVDCYRKLTVPQSQTVQLDETWGLPDQVAGVEQTLTQAEAKRHLVREIRALGEPDSEIMIRKYFLGQSTRSIAQALELKENTVDKKVSRGLGKLRQALGGVRG